MDKDLKYGDASLRVRENMVAKIKGQLNTSVTDSGLRFLKLIEIIPNWETYLTIKQLEVAKRYVTCMSAYEVDHQLKLNYGTTQQRLFGNNKSSKGAIGRLEEVIKRLENNGYFERQKKLHERVKSQSNTKKSKVSPETLAKTKELIKLIVAMPDYDKYLTKIQSERIYHFIRLRNYKATALHLGITETALKSCLLGKKDGEGALGKLKKAIEENTISSWEDI